MAWGMPGIPSGNVPTPAICPGFAGIAAELGCAYVGFPGIVAFVVSGAPSLWCPPRTAAPRETARSISATRAALTLTVTTVPAPKLSSTEMAPPAASTYCWTMGSPAPVPRI